MARGVATMLAALALVAGARASDGGSISARVTANPLTVALTVNPARVPAGSWSTALASVDNLGRTAFANVAVTLRADPTLTIAAATQTITGLPASGHKHLKWQVCSRVPGNFLLVASARSGAFEADSAAQLLQVGRGHGACR